MPRKSEDKTKPIGVGLRASKWERVQAVAAKEQISIHSLDRFVIMKFIQMYERGEITIETETKKTPKMAKGSTQESICGRRNIR